MFNTQVINIFKRIVGSSFLTGLGFVALLLLSQSGAASAATTLSKSFSPATIDAGGVSTLTITLNNPNGTVATLIAPLVDYLPSGMVVSGAGPGASTTCGGPLVALTGSSAVMLLSGSIPANGSCTVSARVTAAYKRGSYYNRILAAALKTTNGHNPRAAVATLTITRHAPTVTLTVPANGVTGVATNTQITATFSEAMRPFSVSATTFRVVNTTLGGIPVPGTVTYSGVTAVFTPTGNLAASTTYTATITTGVKNLAGVRLAVNKVWSFTTGLGPDTTAPTVSSTDPANGATGVVLNQKIAATFTEAMDPLTITGATFSVVNTTLGGTAVFGTVSYSGVTAVFTPAVNLQPNTVYTATITTGAEDVADNPMASDYVWSFTTGVAPDFTAPTVISTDPANGDIGVAFSKRISATFSEAMDPLTINNVNFTLANGGTPVTGTVTYVGLTATFRPDNPLAADTTYTATINTLVEDLAGNPLATDKVWSFTTAATQGAGPLPVDLGTAGNFVILTKSGISTTGTTAIVGDIGVSPIDHTALTGFSETIDPSGEFSTSIYVSGKLYAADYAPPTPAKMTTAISDMEIAFADAAGRTLPDAIDLGAGNISGMTLVPGLYKWGTGVLITNSGVTLTGGPEDVWIFQIGVDLTVNSGAIVHLSGGALAKNIFWQVSGQATLGTTSDFSGIILSQTLISFNAGAVMNGRAMAQTAVTLNATSITAP